MASFVPFDDTREMEVVADANVIFGLSSWYSSKQVGQQLLSSKKVSLDGLPVVAIFFVRVTLFERFEDGGAQIFAGVRPVQGLFQIWPRIRRDF